MIVQYNYSWLLLTLVLALMSNSRAFFPAARRVRAPPIAFMSPDKLSFGNKMDIRVRLPTRDAVLAENFLQQPHLIVEAAYDASQYVKRNNTSYLIQFAQIPIPGVDTVSPEVEVSFVYQPAARRVVMQSQSWTLKGGPIVRDSQFLKSFHLLLEGVLALELNPQTGAISAVGQVEYSVRGDKPALLRAAPPFILDGTIRFIQSCVADFVLRQFGAKLLAAFQAFSRP
eukprot:gene37112-45048_t